MHEVEDHEACLGDGNAHRDDVVRPERVDVRSRAEEQERLEEGVCRQVEVAGEETSRRGPNCIKATATVTAVSTMSARKMTT